VAENYQEQTLSSLVVGITTCIGGIILVLRHLHVWRQKTDATEDANEKRFHFSQLRRRALTSTCIAVLGFIISLFYFRDYWRDRPTSWVILVCCSLILIVMIFFLAAFDMLAVSNAIRADKEKTSNAAKELAREYHRMKGKATDQEHERSSESAAERP